jgi:hypothetical protein
MSVDPKTVHRDQIKVTTSGTIFGSPYEQDRTYSVFVLNVVTDFKPWTGMMRQTTRVAVDCEGSQEFHFDEKGWFKVGSAAGICSVAQRIMNSRGGQGQAPDIERIRAWCEGRSTESASNLPHIDGVNCSTLPTQ